MARWHEGHGARGEDRPGGTCGKTGPWLLVGLLVIVGGAATMIHGRGWIERFDLSLALTAIRELGFTGAAAHVVAFAILQPFGVSSHVFVLSAGALWPTPLAIAVAWLGALGAGIVAFACGRWLARDWLQRRFSPRFRRWDRLLERHGFRTVLLLRLVFFTFPPIHWVLGCSRVRFGPFVAASAIGLLPMAILEVVIGARLGSAIGELTWNPSTLALTSGFVAAMIAMIFVARRIGFSALLANRDEPTRSQVDDEPVFDLPMVTPASAPH